MHVVLCVNVYRVCLIVHVVLYIVLFSLVNVVFCGRPSGYCIVIMFWVCVCVYIVLFVCVCIVYICVYCVVSVYIVLHVCILCGLYIVLLCACIFNNIVAIYGYSLLFTEPEVNNCFDIYYT